MRFGSAGRLTPKGETQGQRRGEEKEETEGKNAKDDDYEMWVVKHHPEVVQDPNRIEYLLLLIFNLLQQMRQAQGDLLDLQEGGNELSISCRLYRV